MKFCFLFALPIVVKCATTSIPALKNTAECMPTTFTGCNSTVHSVAHIFSQFFECIHRLNNKENRIPRDLSQDQIKISRRCFATSTQAAHRYGFCPMSHYTVDLPGFAWLSWGPLALFADATELAEQVLQEFLTEPMCFVRAYWPPLWAEFITFAEHQNKTFPSEFELPKVAELLLADPQNWANWFNSVSMRIMHGVAIKECETKYPDSSFNESTIECIDVFQRQIDSRQDFATSICECQKSLGTGCIDAYYTAGDAFCDFVESLRMKTENAVNLLQKMIVKLEKHSTRLPEERAILVCNELVKKAFVTKKNNWFSLMEEATDKCISDGWSFDEFIQRTCEVLVKNVKTIAEDTKHIDSLRIIATTVVDSIIRVLSGPNNYSVVMDMETLLSALIEAMNEVDVKKEQPETRDVATMTDPLSEDLPITDPSTFKDSNMYSNMPDSMDAETRIAEHIDANNHRCALILQFLQGIIDEKKLDISN